MNISKKFIFLIFLLFSSIVISCSKDLHFSGISENSLNEILENYQIKVSKYLDGSYVKKNFKNDIELSEMSYRISCGHNQNEVMFVPKNTKKKAFFEKFFQLFS